MAPNVEIGNGNWLMRTIVGAFGIVIMILISLGYNNLVNYSSRLEGSLKEVAIELKKKTDDGENRDKVADRERNLIDKRVSALEIWVTMPYDQRLKALQQLHRVKP